MLLVLIAVAAAMILSLGFVSSQSTTLSVSQNLESHDQARAIAESAMAMATSYIGSSDDWRTEHTDGVWVTNASFGGGTYSITVNDGDEHGGDGSFNDDNTDPVKVTVVGRFNGVSHTLTNVVTPASSGGKTVMFVVDDANNLGTYDAAKKALMEGFGWKVVPISDDAAAGEFTAAMADSVAMYVSSTVSASTVASKIVNAPIGIVDECSDLIDDLGISSSANNNNADSVKITNNTHDITSVFAVGDMTISTSKYKVTRLSGSQPADLIILGTRTNNSQITIAALDAGKINQNGVASPGRRVMLPWGESNFDPAVLNDNGKTLMQRSILWATKPMVPPPPVAHYTFDETGGLTAADSSGNNNTGALVNGPTYTPTSGTINGSINFDGVNDYVQVDNAPALNPTSQISFSVWVKSSNWAGGNPRILQKGTNDDQYRFLSEWGEFKFDLTGVGTLTVGYPDTAKWIHLAATYNGSQMKIYFNGVEVASKSASGSIATTNTPLYIGTKHNTAPSGDHFKGQMDDLRIYNVGLNSAEVKYLYDLGEPDEAGPLPRLIAKYDFKEVRYDPVLIHYWKLDEPGSAAMPGLSLSQSFTASGPWTVVNSYHSTAGAYNAESATPNAALTVNSTSSGAITMSQSSVVQGDAYIGPGGNVTSGFSVSSGANITGTRGVLSSAVTIPSTTAPTGSPFNGSHEGNYSLSGSSTATLNSNHYYNKMTLSGSSVLTISGNVTILLNQELNIDAGAEIRIASGSHLNLYIKNDLILNGKLNVNGADPTRLDIYMLGTNKTITLDNSGECYGLARNPSGDLTIRNQCHFYGGFTGKTMTLSDGRFHMDLDTTANGANMTSAIDDVASSPGVLTNGPVAGQTGFINKAVQFDGTNDYIKVAHHDSMRLDTGTIAFRFKSSSLSSIRGLVSKDASNYNQGGGMLIYTEGSAIKAKLESTTSTYTAASGNVLSTNTWYHAALTFGPQGMKLYLNGSLVASNAWTGGLNTSAGGTGNAEPLVFGASTASSTTGTASPQANYFQGYLDDIRMYDQALDATQVSKLYQQQSLGTTSSAGYIVSDVGGFGTPLNLWIEDTSKISWITGGGLSVNSATRIYSPGAATKLKTELSASDEMTLDLIYTPAVDNQSGPAAIVSYGNTATNRNFTFGQSNKAYDFKLRTSNSGNDGTPAVTSGNVLTANGAEHVVIAYDQSAIRVYRNGALDKTLTRTGTLDTWDQTMPFVLANEYTSNKSWTGKLSYLAIYDRAVNSLQAQDLFNGNPPGDYSDLKNVSFSVRWIENP